VVPVVGYPLNISTDRKIYNLSSENSFPTSLD